MILTTSVVALVYNVVHSGLIHKTSAVTVTVLGELKICGILMLSAWLLGKLAFKEKGVKLLQAIVYRHFEDTQSLYFAGERLFCIPHVAVGIVLALFGFVGYSHARLNVKGHMHGRRASSSSKISHSASVEPVDLKQKLLSEP